MKFYFKDKDLREQVVNSAARQKISISTLVEEILADAIRAPKEPSLSIPLDPHLNMYIYQLTGFYGLTKLGIEKMVHDYLNRELGAMFRQRAPSLTWYNPAENRK